MLSVAESVISNATTEIFHCFRIRRVVIEHYRITKKAINKLIILEFLHFPTSSGTVVVVVVVVPVVVVGGA